MCLFFTAVDLWGQERERDEDEGRELEGKREQRLMGGEKEIKGERKMQYGSSLFPFCPLEPKPFQGHDIMRSIYTGYSSVRNYCKSNIGTVKTEMSLALIVECGMIVGAR